MKKEELKKLIKECIEELLAEGFDATILDPATGQEIDVEVEYTYHPGHTGTRDGMARFAEPDEGAMVEIDSITASDGRNIDPDSLDDDTRSNLEQQILESHEGQGEYQH